MSGVLTTEQRPKAIINHPYTREDSSGSEKGVAELIERQTLLRSSQHGQRAGSIALSKRISTVGEKKKALMMKRYINPLARLDYEDKMEEVYTKYTRMSKASVLKKIKAKNRIAEFEDEEDEVHEAFDELI